MFTTDSRTENMLTKFGVVWRYTNAVTFADLSPNWGSVNLGRSQVKVDQAVVEYAERMESGSAAPAPILWLDRLGYAPLDGVQRLLAAELRGETQFSAYVIDTDSRRTTKIIRVMANSLLAGHADTPEWTKRHAVQILMVDEGMSADEVAAIGGWKIKDVLEEFMAQSIGFRLRCAGGPDTLSKSLLLVLAKHAKADDIDRASAPIVEFCHDLKKGRFSHSDADPFVQAFFRVSRGTTKQPFELFSQRLEEFRSSPEVIARLKGRKAVSRAPDVKLLAALKSALTIANKLVVEKRRILYLEEHSQLVRQIDVAIGKLRDLKKRKKAPVK